MINTNDAYREIEETETTPAADVVDKTEKAETETPKTDTTVEDKAEDVKDETVASPKTESTGEDKTPTQKHEYTSQEKINYSFSKMKKKHREEVEALNKKIEEQQKIIDQFNAKSRDSYQSEEEYLDAKLDMRDAQRELNRTRQEQLAMAERQQAEVMRDRVIKLYPTENLQKVYTEACQLGQQNGALQAMMEDRVVKEYLFGNGKDTGSDKGPLLIEAFCRQPKLLEKILDTSDNRKGFAMYDLEQRLSKMVEEAEQKARTHAQTASPQATTPTQATTAIPVVGKVANAGTNKSAPSDDWASEKELFKFARS